MLPLDAPVPNAVLNMTYSVYTWDAGIRITGSASYSTLQVQRTPPLLRSVSPNPLLLQDADESGEGATLTLNGAGIRTVEEILDPRNGLVGRLASPNVTVTIDGSPCTGVKVVRTRAFPLGYVTCKYPTQELPGGLHVVRMTMVDRVTTLDPSDGLTAGLYTACAAGFYGLFAVPGQQACRNCPRGAGCAEGVGLPPIAEPGFYNMGLPARSNASGSGDRERQSVVGVAALGPSACPADVVVSIGRPLACVVPCDPPESCLGDNMCADGYASTAPVYRCASCAAGFFRTSGVCNKCPAVGSLTLSLLVLAVLGSLLLLYILSNNDIRLGSADLVLEYAQLLSLLQGPTLPWPPAIKTFLSALSILRVNIEVTAPECYSSISLTPEWKLWLVLVLPVLVLCCSVLGYLTCGWFKGWLLQCRHRARMDTSRTTSAPGAQQYSHKAVASRAWSHGPVVCRTTLKLLGALYLPCMQSSLEVWNCTPTEPSDGKEYLAIAFEPCWTPGGLQARMLPWAQAGLVIYGALYPLLLAVFLFRYSNLITEDQILLAAGTGEDARSNPRAYALRQYFNPLYVDYKPGKHWFALVKHARAALVCICALMLNKSPVLVAASVVFSLFMALSLHNAVLPLMTPQSGYMHALNELSVALREDSPGANPSSKGQPGLTSSMTAAQGEWCTYWRGRVQELAKLTHVQALRDVAEGRSCDVYGAATYAATPSHAFVLDWNFLEAQLKGHVILTGQLSIMYNAGTESVYAARSVPAVSAAFFILQIVMFCHIAVTVGWDVLFQVRKAVREWLAMGSEGGDEQEDMAAVKMELDRLDLYDAAASRTERCQSACLLFCLCCFRGCVNRRRARAIVLSRARGSSSHMPQRGVPDASTPVPVPEWTKNPLDKPDRRSQTVLSWGTPL